MMRKPTTCKMNTQEYGYKYSYCTGIMKNKYLYRKFICSLVEMRCEHYLENDSRLKDNEIIKLLTATYKGLKAAKRNVNAIRMMFRKYREKIRTDIATYKIDGTESLYPPEHEIYIQNKLFPYLDAKIFEVCESPTYSHAINNKILRGAVYYMHRGVQWNDPKFSRFYISYLKRQAIKWLGTKLIPKKFHRYIYSVQSIETILTRISEKKNIRLKQLKILVRRKYLKIRSELRERADVGGQIVDNKCESSEKTITHPDNISKKNSESGTSNNFVHHENSNAENNHEANEVHHESSSSKLLKKDMMVKIFRTAKILKIQLPSTPSTGTAGDESNRSDSSGIMENMKLYKKLIKTLVEKKWIFLIKKSVKNRHKEILSFLVEVYEHTRDAKQNLNIVQAMFEDYREKIKEDIGIYISNADAILYPPRYEERIQDQLFAFLDENISLIFESIEIPTRIPTLVFKEASRRFANHYGDPNENSQPMYDHHHLKIQCVKWLAKKLLPAEFQSCIVRVSTFPELEARISSKKSIAIGELRNRIAAKYQKYRSELCLDHDEQEEMHVDDNEDDKDDEDDEDDDDDDDNDNDEDEDDDEDDEDDDEDDEDDAGCKSSEEQENDITYSKVTGVSVKKTNNPFLKPVNDGITVGKIIEKSGDCDTKAIAESSTNDFENMFTDDESIDDKDCDDDYNYTSADESSEESEDSIEHSTNTDIPIEEINDLLATSINHGITEKKITEEPNANTAKVIAENSANDGTDMFCDDDSVLLIEYPENTAANDNPREEIHDPPQKPINDEIIARTIKKEPNFPGTSNPCNNKLTDLLHYIENIVSNGDLMEEIINVQLSPIEKKIAEVKIKLEPDVCRESVIVENPSGTRIPSKVQSLHSMKNSCDTLNTDVPMIELVDLTEETTDVKTIKAEISADKMLKHFDNSGNPNPDKNLKVDTTPPQLHHLSSDKRRMKLGTLRRLKRWLDNSVLERTELINQLENKTRIVNVKIGRLMAEHIRYKKMVSKKMKIINSKAMTKQTRMLKVMAKILDERFAKPVSN